MPSIRDVWLPANRVIRSARQVINQRLGPMGLSSAEGNILMYMAASQRSVCQEELADDLDISKGAVSRAVGSLEGKGYIQRARDLRDRRYAQLQLTEKARALSADIALVYDELYARATKGITEEEFDALMRILNQVSENLSEN